MRVLLGITGLMLMLLAGCAGRAQPKEIAQPDGRWPRSVTGRGETVELAKKDALREAVKTISIAMKLHDPPLQAFVVNEDYVRTRLLDSKSGEPGKDEKIQLNDVEHVFKAWVLTFRTDNEWWKDIVRRDQEGQRKLRADERQTLGSHVVIGLAFLLLAGYGYVRLDEYTQRRYTTWLRVVGIGVAATVIAGWWWVCFQAPMAPMAPG
jgi:hypothetical protein